MSALPLHSSASPAGFFMGGPMQSEPTVCNKRPASSLDGPDTEDR